MGKEIVDFLILGQGLSGTALAILLEEKQASFKIVVDNQSNGASRKAVGLMNPITGRRTVKTWNCDEIFPLAFQFYKRAYNKIFGANFPDKSFLETIPIYKALHTVEEMNYISGKSAWEEYNSIISITKENEDFNSIFSSTIGWCKIEMGGRLDTKFFLNSAFGFFANKGELIVEKFKPEALIRNDGYWEYGDIKAKNVVSCLGMACPWLDGELIPVKGQVYVFTGIPQFGKRVLKTDKFFIPNGPDSFLAGSTYERAFRHFEPDSAGFEEIISDLKPDIRSGIQVIDSWAGLRPTNKDRRPIIRKVEEGLFLLNGLGTKGVSLAPWAAGKILELAHV